MSDISKSIELHKDALSHHFSQAAAYSNLIIGAGYAGFFATWSFTKDIINRDLNVAAGFFILISLILFITFEIIKTVSIEFEIAKQKTILSRPEDYEMLMEAYKKTQAQVSLRQFWLWVVFFSLIVTTALCAASIMIFAFVSTLLKCA